MQQYVRALLLQQSGSSPSQKKLHTEMLRVTVTATLVFAMLLEELLQRLDRLVDPAAVAKIRVVNQGRIQGRERMD